MLHALLAVAACTFAVDVRFRVIAPPTTPPEARLFVAGDRAELGAWKPDGLALTRDGDAWTATLTLPEGPFEWKVTLGSWADVEVSAAGADRPNRRSVAEEGATIDAVVEAWRAPVRAPVTSTLTGDVRRVAPPRGAEGLPRRDVLVRLPEGYDDPEERYRRYRVLYMLDGQNVFDVATSFAGAEWRADETVDALVAASSIAPIIVVAIPNSPQRIRELTFAPGGSSEQDASGSAFLSWIADVLKPAIDDGFRTRPEADATVIAGSSLGGLFALEAIARRPEIFARAIAMSPSLWFDDESLLTRWTADPTRRPRPTALWIDMGTDEGRGDPRAHVERVQRLAGLFEAASAVRLVVDSGGRHHESDWSRRLPDALRFVLAPTDDATIPVAVDERVELMSIVARLGGAGEFAMPNSRSPYAERIEAQFGPHREHRAIDAFREGRAKHGWSYDAIPSLALHLGPLPELAERIPFDPRPPRLDARWELDATRDFLDAVRDFVAQSDAERFFASEREFFATTASRLADLVAESDPVPWFDAFFGAKPGATYAVIPGLLCGGGNYGVGVVFPDGAAEEIRPVLGCWQWDDDGLPLFAKSAYLPTFIHELCHSYTNPIADRHAELLEPPVAELFPAVAPRMRRLAYGNPRTVLYETLVRAVVIRFIADREGEAAATAESERQRREGFTWVPELADLLAEYAANRIEYPTFDAFAPKIAQQLGRSAQRVRAEAANVDARAPKVLEMSPADGAEKVDPSIDTLTILFDRPMKRRGWSFVGARADIPEFLEGPSFDDSGRRLTAKVRLAPGRTYRYSLNSDRFTGFVAEDGTPLQQVNVRFVTDSE